MSGPVYLVSDVHLGAVPSEREAAFRRWLAHAGREASTLVVNGDLFDFWFEYSTVIPRGHARTLGVLAEIVDGGTPVFFMGGNHDWWGGSFLENEIGVTFLREPVVIDLAGHRTFLAHGDGMGRGDLGYRLLRAVLRGRLTRWGFRWLHPDLGAKVASLVSKTEHRGGEPTEDEKGRADALEAWAVEKMRQDPSLDIVVLGHTHVPRLRRVAEGRWYVNAGDWVFHRSYVVLREGQAPELREWSDPDVGSATC